MKPTYAQIAQDFNLWGEYVDPESSMTRAEFDNLNVWEKIDLQREMYGEEGEGANRMTTTPKACPSCASTAQPTPHGFCQSCLWQGNIIRMMTIEELRARLALTHVANYPIATQRTLAAIAALEVQQ